MARRRRRRNPVSVAQTGSDIESLLILGVVAVGGYMIYKAVSAAKDLGNSAVAAVTHAAQAAGQVLVPNPTSQAMVYLPDGSSYPYESLAWVGPSSLSWWTLNPNAGAMFDFDGVRYQLSSNSASPGNIYYAYPMQQTGATGSW
jgi:hypothetical protein